MIFFFTDLIANGTKQSMCSPGYDTNSYPLNALIQWNIIAHDGKRVEMTFTDFVVESNFDIVYVREGNVLSVITFIIWYAHKYIDKYLTL